MFSIAERESLRERLVAAARADPAVTAAAVTGSGAVGREDAWSDVDLALCVDDAADMAGVVERWSGRMYREHGCVDHLDVFRGDVLFRVFLLASTLQVDLAFWPAAEFGATAPTFRLLFGTANERAPTPPPRPAGLIGWGWLYALHARSSIARDRVWQAEYMLSGVRDQVFALRCLRHGVSAVQGRGMDDLPPEATAGLAATLIRAPERAELSRAFAVVTEELLAEITLADPALAARLTHPLRELTWPTATSAGTPDQAD